MLSKFSVKKPFTIIVAVIMVLILGTISFLNLQTDLLPDIDLPYLVILTTYPGASPEEIETVVTRPIEQVIATTSNIKNINSISSENSSLVIMEFNNDVNMDSAIIEINGNIDLIKGNWDETISSPMIIRLNPDMLPIMVSSVDIEGMEVTEISDLVSSKIIPDLESVEGVGSVSGSGLLEERVEVVLSQNKIDNLNKKMLEKIDSKLANAEDQLSKAENEIDAGKLKLDSEEKKQMDRLVEAEKAVEDGKLKISQGISGIDAGLTELYKNKETLSASKKLIEAGEDELLKIKEGLVLIGNNLSAENKEKLESVQNKLDEVLNQKNEINQSLELVDSKINELESQKKELNDQLFDLNSKKSEIEKGKNTLSLEMSKARLELKDGEISLRRKLEEFEQAKNEAFKESSLEGVLDKEMISNILKAQNFSMPAGYIEDEGIEYLVKIGDEFKDIKEMENLLLFDSGEEGIGKIYLSDVSDVISLNNSEEIYAKVNGNNAVIMSIQKQSNFSTSQVSNLINKKMLEIEESNEGLSFRNLMDQGVYIDMVVNSVLSNIIYGGILAIVILILFLKAIKPTFIIAVSIPISIIFAIAMMYFTGVTINIISLAGLALGVGMLVDNSIVVIENIYRLRNEGMSASKAAVEGAREVSGAIMASTITTACVFLPIVFTKGISRQLFTDMGLTIAYSLFASLLVALTLVPTMASTILKKTNEKETKLLDKIIDRYTGLLDWVLSHKSLVMIFVVLLLVVSGFLAYTMGTSFIPEMEAAEMSLSIKIPEDKGFDDMIEITDKVIDKLIEIDEIEAVGAFQGGQMMEGMMGGGQSTDNAMSMYLILDENSKRANAEIGRDIEKLTEDMDLELTINTSNMDMSQLGGSGIEVQIKGRDLDILRSIGEDVSDVLDQLEGTTDITTDIDERSREIRLEVNKDKAMENGLTVAQIFAEITSRLSKGKTATSLSLSNKDFPVIVVDEDNNAINKKNLENLKIKNTKDEEISLGDLVKISEEQGLNSIYRKSQERYISVNASIDKDYNIGLVSREFENKLKSYELPEGYSLELEGENKMIKDSLRDLILMVLLAIVFIYLIMVAQFQSLLSPFIVMFTIPLAFTGGLLGLWITGNNISLIAMLGFLVLSGVVVNNGIVFVDYTNQLRLAGLDKREALIRTGKTRFRPILMTAITTVLGLSTLSVGIGVGAEILQPLAIVAIGGLVYATLLTLLVVPVMYDILHRRDIKKIIIEGDE